jgi:hypothetical protein
VEIDYQKLLDYLKEKYGVTGVFYFGGVEIHDFKYNYQTDETVPLRALEKHLLNIIQSKGKELNEAQLLLIGSKRLAISSS